MFKKGNNYIKPIQEECTLQLKVLPGKIYEIDLSKELSIDMDNLKEELMSQYTNVVVLGTVLQLCSRRKTSSVGIFSNEQCNKSQLGVLQTIKDAFEHKKVAILQLLAGHTPETIMQGYYQNLSEVRDLLGKVS